MKLYRHPWVVAACNFALVMAIFSLSRVFYLLIDHAAYPEAQGSHLWELLFGGVRFDLTALLYLNSVYLLLQLFPLRLRQSPRYQRIAQWFYWIPNGLAIIINCIDMVYMQFTGRRTTIDFFSEFQNEGNLATIFFTAVIQYWYVTLFAIAMIVLMVLLTRREVETEDKRHLIIYYISETALLLVSVYFVVIGIRGGFGAFTRPITLSNALAYTNHPNETNIVLNTPFAIMRSTEGKTFPTVVYYPEEELEAVMSPIHPAPSSAPMQPKNVVIFILESFSKEYLGHYTPFLDSLSAQALTFDLSLANGRKSIDAMPSILSSIPMLITPYILTPYSTNDVGSLASYLGAKGWQTAFFHGAPNGSMGFQAYARSCGFDAYYGKDEYNNNADYDGYWAIWDEEFLQFFGRTMTEMQQPFMTAVFTATSHHPFQIPKRYEGVFPEGTHPLHKCIGYTDNALRKFFDYAKQQPWYTNTLFVLTADHTNALSPENENDKGRYEVPIIFFDPQMDEALRTKERHFPVSQVDIMPSVLAYLGYNEPYFAFGEDVITRDKEHPYVVNYNHPVYQIFSDSLLLQFDGQEVTGVYNFRHAETQPTDEMLRYLKATIQQYITRIKNNRLTWTKE